ncbi:hypothetical protein ACFLYL_02750 [Chloroflexota bacterium]
MVKKFNYYDRKKLLEAQQGGESKSDLKRTFGIKDDRTLFRHLKLAEQEEQSRLVKVEIIKDALLKHYAEIRVLIDQWKNNVRTPRPDEVYPGTSSPMDTIKTNPIFISLKDHLPFPTLWSNHLVYVKKLDDYIDGCTDLRKQVAKEVKSWNGVEDELENAAQPILRIMAEGESAIKLKPYEFKLSEQSNYPDKTVINAEGMPIFTVSKETDSAPIKKQYQDYSQTLLAGEAGTNLVALFSELKNDLEPKIKDSLQEILLRRDYIMYTCKLCPGQPRLLRK